MRGAMTLLTSLRASFGHQGAGGADSPDGGESRGSQEGHVQGESGAS